MEPFREKGESLTSKSHRLSGGPSASAKKSHKGDAHQRGRSAFEELSESDSRWNSGSRALTDRPPLHPFSRHERSRPRCASTKEHHKEPGVEEPRPTNSIRSLQQCGARLSSDSRPSFGLAPSQALVHRRMIVGPSSISATNESLKDAVKIKNRATLLQIRLRCSRLSERTDSQIVRHFFRTHLRFSCPFFLEAR